MSTIREEPTRALKFAVWACALAWPLLLAGLSAPAFGRAAFTAHAAALYFGSGALAATFAASLVASLVNWWQRKDMHERTAPFTAAVAFAGMIAAGALFAFVTVFVMGGPTT